MTDQIQQSGFSISGSYASLYGAIYDLNVEPGEMGMALVTWSYEPTVNAADQIGVFVDGQLAQRLESTATSVSLAGIHDGDHSISVIPMRADDNLASYIGDPFGGRAYLSWPASPSRDTVAYNVWMRTSSTGAYTLAGVVDTVRVDEATMLKTATGGRVSYKGNVSTVLNEVLTVILNGDGTFSYSNSDATTAGSGTFDNGSTLHLPYGIILTVHDMPEAYDGDQVAIRAGVRTDWVSGSDLATSTDLYFSVTAVDQVGHESDPLSDFVLQLPTMPSPAENIRWEWDSTGEVVTLLWDKPADADSVAIYSNWDNDRGALADHVITDNPVYSSSGVSGSWQISGAGQVGTLKAYVRTSLGALELEDISLYSFSLPPAPADIGIVLGDVADFTASSLAEGRYLLSWSYAYDIDDSVDAFAIYAGATEAGIDWETPVAVLTVASLNGGTGYPVARFSYEEPAAVPAGLPMWFGIKARAITGFESGAMTAEFIPDTVPPTLTGTVIGAVQ